MAIEQLERASVGRPITRGGVSLFPIYIHGGGGIDIGAHAEIVKLIRSLCAEGMSLLVASSELDELVAFSNKVVVLRDRYAVRELSGAELTSQHVMQAIAEG